MDGSYVGKPCPKCAHLRAASDPGPAWQCPKCGIAYAKFQPAGAAPAPEALIRPAGGGAAIQRGAAGQSYTLAAFAHFSILLGFVIPLLALVVPIVIWKTKEGEDDFAVAAAKEAINFQLSFLLWCVGLGTAAVACMIAPPLIYLVILLIGVVVLGYLVLPIVAGFKTLAGDSYSYPFIRHFFD